MADGEEAKSEIVKRQLSEESRELFAKQALGESFGEADPAAAGEAAGGPDDYGEASDADDAPDGAAELQLPQGSGAPVEVSGKAASALAANAAVPPPDAKTRLRMSVKRPSLSGKAFTQGKGFKSAKNRIKVKGKVIDGEHEQYALTYGMMLGISVSVRIGARRDAHHPDKLQLSDFQDKISLDFPPEGSTLTQPHDLNHSFHFKDYAPRAFSRIRKCFGVTTTSYAESLCGDLSFVEFQSNSRSGQFFFFSQDGRYMIKTQTKEECKFLLRILPRYYRHVKNHPHTLVTRFLGMHRVEMGHIRRKVRFIIMGSVFATEETLHTTADLKGSLAGRLAKGKERVIKDQDVVKRGIKLKLGEERKAIFMDQVRKDVAFLAALEVMDYSLLLGIAGGEGHEPVSTKGVMSGDGPGERSSIAEGSDEDDDDADVTADEAAAMEASFERSSTSRGASSGAGDDDGDDDDLDADVDAIDVEGVDDDAADALPTSNTDPSVALSKNNKRFFRKVPQHLGVSVRFSDADRDDPSLSAMASGRSRWLLSDRYDGGIESADGSGPKELYFTGVIDFLQQYNARKHMETGVHMFKWAIGGRNYLEASCVSPVSYSTRFVQFLDKMVT